jgi:hypothetical protein
MLTASDFRTFAETCTRMAGATKAEVNKTTLQKMADKWTELAENADRMRRLVRDADAALDGANPPNEKERVRRRFSGPAAFRVDHNLIQDAHSRQLLQEG